jgi:phospholipase/carboxylesterase
MGNRVTGGRMISRRNFLKLAGGAAGATSFGLLTATSCGGGEAMNTTTSSSSGTEEETTTDLQQEVGDEAERARLLARPGEATAQAVSTGLQPLGLGSERDGLLYVPEGYTPTEEAPMALTLHGSKGDAQSGISHFLEFADEAGLVLLAPESRDPRDWDFVFPGYYGPDVEFIDRALQHTFDRLAVDAGRLAIEGFSDGASYAVSLGLANGDLFTHVIGFSPGLVDQVAQRGNPSVFIAHGTGDERLPIKESSGRRVERLERDGYEVRFRKFDGGHEVPTEVAREAVEWFVD